jgi:hypothetical protein
MKAEATWVPLAICIDDKTRRFMKLPTYEQYKWLCLHCANDEREWQNYKNYMKGELKIEPNL